jgi:hypothetical protein
MRARFAKFVGGAAAGSVTMPRFVVDAEEVTVLPRSSNPNPATVPGRVAGDRVTAFA